MFKASATQKYGGVWKRFKLTLEELGYATGRQGCVHLALWRSSVSQTIDSSGGAKGIALPERFADLLGYELLVPERDPDSCIVSVRQAIGHLPVLSAGQQHPSIPNHRARHLHEINVKRLSAAKPGESNAYMEAIPKGDLSLVCHRKVNSRLDDRCFGDVYTRMHPDKPSPTITTKCHSISNGRFGHFDTEQVREITPREAAILQSFSDNYIFYPLDQIEPVARMIGNAVPPKLAAFI